RGDVSALRIRVFTLAGMAVQLRRNTHQKAFETKTSSRLVYLLVAVAPHSSNTSSFSLAPV
ncbi:hypothetical protein ACK3ZM_20355, partial [Aeromonas caviae]